MDHLQTGRRGGKGRGGEGEGHSRGIWGKILRSSCLATHSTVKSQQVVVEEEEREMSKMIMR